MPTFLDYAKIAQDLQNQQQKYYQDRAVAQQNLVLFQQAQVDRQRQQALQEKLGNALPQLAAPPPQAQQSTPQAPAPGQASQPMQQASVPLPGMGPAPGGVRSPIPPGGVQGAMPPSGLPPFRPMPTTPPQSVAAPQGQIPAYPAQAAASPDSNQGGPLSFQNAIKILSDKGLQGAELFQGLQLMMPVLDNQAKMQTAAAQAQFNNELHIAQLQQRHDDMVQRSEDKTLDRESRADLAREAQATRLQIAQLQASTRLRAAGADAVATDTLLSPEAKRQMAEDYLTAPDQSIFTNLGRGRQGAANVVGLRNEIAKLAKERGMSGADIAALRIGVGGEKAAARTAGTKAANIDLAATEAQQTFPLVRKYSAAIPRTQIPPLNDLIAAAETKTGDTRWIQLGSAITTAANAYSRGVSPTGVPSVSDKEHNRESLYKAMTDGQVNAVLDVWQQEMAAAQRAPTEVKQAQRQRITGKGEAPAAGPTRINSDAEYDALPSGASFVAPDGTTRRKP